MSTTTPSDDLQVIHSPAQLLARDAQQRRTALPLQSLTCAQRRSLDRRLGLWLLLVTGFFVWWLMPQHIVSPLHLAVSTVLLSWSVLLPGYFFFFLRRLSRPSPATPLPQARVAMIVTKAPSEPWPVVRRTLEGMLSQGDDHDTWLADEQPDTETLAWCQANGVQVSTRFGIEDYHRDAWPRRTRCKEGNLAYFYDTVGYRSYDLIVQLDADHVPEAGYLDAMLRPFADPSVGYVSAPSICDANNATSWSARARTWAEAGMHGALQAGANGGFAPLCIGSHYAVRTRALRDIGGLGPELAEDHSTTLMMNAGGWRGVHALDATAHGDGPESFPDLMVQEFQWSRSLVNLLLTLTPKVLGRMPWRLRAQFMLSQMWYPLFAVAMTASIVVPIIALMTSTPWMRVPYAVFLANGALLSASVLLILSWVKRNGFLRPVDAPLLSWEAALFTVMRWPWVAIGTIAALTDSVRGKAFAFTVTPKGGDGARPLPLRVLLPHFVIIAISVAAALRITEAGAANGYFWFVLCNAALYSIGVTVVLVQHLRENPRTSRRRTVPVPALLLLLLASLTLVACVQRGEQVVDAMTWTGGPPTTTAAPEDAPEEPAAVAPDPTIGVIDMGEATVNLGIYDGYEDFGESNRFAIGHHFVGWNDETADSIAALFADDVALGRWPLLTVEPHPVAGGEETLLADIAEGAYDAQMDAMCEGLATTGTPAFVRFGHEMENVTGRYPWAVEDADAYIAAFQHAESRCRTILGEDLFMVWSPVGMDGAADYWPGAEHVDYVGLSLFDFPDFQATVGGDPDATFDEGFWPRYERIRDFDKPVMIAEMATARTGEDKVDWLNDMITSAADYPLLRTIVLFHGAETPGVWGDAVDTPTWRVEPSTLPNG